MKLDDAMKELIMSTNRWYYFSFKVSLEPDLKNLTPRNIWFRSWKLRSPSVMGIGVSNSD
jgi:hypothetical protein